MSGEGSWRVEQSVSRELNVYVGRATRPVEKSRMQSNATNDHSNRIHSSNERLESSTANISQTYRAQKEPSKLRAADYVERNDHAKRDGEVLLEAFNAIRSMKVMGVTLQVHYEKRMRCDKPSVTNLVSSTEVPL